MKYGRGFQPAKIRHRLDIYTVTRLSRDVRWVEAWQRNVVQAKQMAEKLSVVAEKLEATLR